MPIGVPTFLIVPGGRLIPGHTPQIRDYHRKVPETTGEGFQIPHYPSVYRSALTPRTISKAEVEAVIETITGQTSFFSQVIKGLRLAIKRGLEEGYEAKEIEWHFMRNGREYESSCNSLYGGSDRRVSVYPPELPGVFRVPLPFESLQKIAVSVFNPSYVKTEAQMRSCLQYRFKQIEPALRDIRELFQPLGFETPQVELIAASLLYSASGVFDELKVDYRAVFSYFSDQTRPLLERGYTHDQLTLFFVTNFFKTKCGSMAPGWPFDTLHLAADRYANHEEVVHFIADAVDFFRSINYESAGQALAPFVREWFQILVSRIDVSLDDLRGLVNFAIPYGNILGSQDPRYKVTSDCNDDPMYFLTITLGLGLNPEQIRNLMRAGYANERRDFFPFRTEGIDRFPNQPPLPPPDEIYAELMKAVT